MRSLALAGTVVLLLVGAVAPAVTVGGAPGADQADPSPDHAALPTSQAALTPGQATLTPGQAAVTDTSSDWCPTDREAPTSDKLGWENGCWWDADIQVDRSDGLNDSELRKVVGRSMARVEKVRQLEFQRDIPVEVISREQHREEFAERYNLSTDAALRENVVLEGAMLVGENESAVAAQKRTFGSATLGYYDTETGNITIISENASTPKMNEITLSQELFHALQDRRWNISAYDRGTWEAMNANNGIVEGDGNYVDHLYQQRCREDWDCLERQSQAGGGGNIHYGIYTLFLQSYSDGPAFVRSVREAKGWEGVNAIYENPPASTEQTIHPERYPDEAPVNVSVTDSSNEAWRVPEPPKNTARYGKLGEAGLYVMFLYPAIESGGEVRQQMARNFYNAPPSQLQGVLDPYNYSYHASEGWAGDKLIPYVTNDSAETNETAYVWKLRWDTEQDAKQFVSEYHWLLDYYGAQPVDGRVDTFLIPDADHQFGDAFYVNQTGKTVTIVNAPTADQLSAVHEGAAPEGSGDTNGSWDNGTGPATTPTESSDGTLGPGFGVVTALVALVALLVVAIACRR